MNSRRLQSLRRTPALHRIAELGGSRTRSVAVQIVAPDRAAADDAAAAVARDIGAEVYRVDLAQVVSTYIGETGKKLDAVFAAAAARGAVLLLDEADDLFGSRTGVRDAHDRVAAIDSGRLWQRIDAFAGITMIATRRAAALDDETRRRLRYVVDLPLRPPPR